MTPSVWRRVDAAARAAMPFCITVLLALVPLAHSRIPGLAAVAPVLPVSAVYFWSIYRPAMMPLAAAFAVGLLIDLVAGTPPGIFALVLMLVRLVVVSQRRFLLGKPFPIVWWGFGMVAAGAGCVAWLLAALNLGRPLLVSAAVFQFLLTFGAYPVMSWLLVRADRALVHRS